MKVEGFRIRFEPELAPNIFHVFSLLILRMDAYQYSQLSLTHFSQYQVRYNLAAC